MKKIKLLDCTLRDGGYVNNFEFGYDVIKKIISKLSESKIDFIECGFLKSCVYDKNKTIFDEIKSFKNLTKNILNTSKLCLMINFGEIDIEKIEQNNNSNLFLKVCFKQYQMQGALEFCAMLAEKGYNIFISPMHVHSYSKILLEKLIKKVNEINPYAYSIVDTIGVLNENSLCEIFDIADKNLNKEISICYHSHNNLDLSYKNALYLIDLNTKRNLILDCTLLGLGRGAGNLKTELIARDLKNYNLDLLNKTIKNYILPIYQTIPKDKNSAYKLSANCLIHPNYAKFAIDNNLPSKKIKEIFSLIPKDKKENFDIEAIKALL